MAQVEGHAEMKPLASIVIPTYNRARLLERAVKSALAQTFQPTEVIVVDDGSTDDTPVVVRGLHDSRLRYIRHDTNRGAAAAINTGISAALGAFISFLDSDDVVRPDWIEQCVSAMVRDPAIGIAWGWKGIFDRQGRMYSVAFVDPFRRRGIRELLPLMLVWTPGIGGMVIRREAVSAIGGLDPEVQNLADLDFGLRFALNGGWRTFVVEKLLYEVHFEGGNISEAGHPTYLRSLEAFLRKHKAVLARYPREAASWYYRAARVCESLGLSAQARAWLRAAIRAAPWWWKPYVWWGAKALGLQGALGRLASARTRRDEASRLRMYRALTGDSD